MQLTKSVFMQRGPDPGFPYISPSLSRKGRDLMMSFETPLFFVSFESQGYRVSNLRIDFK